MSEERQRPIRVLVVDDDEAHAEALVDGLEIDGHLCQAAHSGKEAITLLEEKGFDCVLLDLVLHDMTGIDVLGEVMRLQPEAVSLMVTGHATVETAVDAMRRGAVDYLTKPVNIAALRARLVNAVEAVRLRRDNIELRRQLDERFGFEGLIGHSPKMQRVLDRKSVV